MSQSATLEASIKITIGMGMGGLLVHDLESYKRDANISAIRQRLGRNPAELQLSRREILDCLEASVLASREETDDYCVRETRNSNIKALAAAI